MAILEPDQKRVNISRAFSHLVKLRVHAIREPPRYCIAASQGTRIGHRDGARRRTINAPPHRSRAHVSARMDDAAGRNKKMFVAGVPRDILKKETAETHVATLSGVSKQQGKRTFSLQRANRIKPQKKPRGLLLARMLSQYLETCMTSLMTALDGLNETCKTELRRPVQWAALSICYA